MCAKTWHLSGPTRRAYLHQNRVSLTEPKKNYSLLEASRELASSPLKTDENRQIAPQGSSASACKNRSSCKDAYRKEHGDKD